MRIAFCAILAAAGFVGSAQADELGKSAYEQYCSTCHGTDAGGGGPLSEMLTVVTPDLRQLSARNDGVFPMLQVIHVIDGRTGMRAHGGPMPVYGAIFDSEIESPGPYGAVTVTRAKILSIAYYLEGLQQE